VRCELAEKHLAAYIDGELDASLAASVEQHLKECRACRETVRDMRLASAVLTKWQNARPTVSMVEVIRKRIAEEGIEPESVSVKSIEEIRKRRRVRAARRWVTKSRVTVAAAAVLLVVAFGWLLTRMQEGVPVRTTRDAVGSVASITLKVERLEDVRSAEMALEGTVGQLWSERKPRADVIVPLEVAGTMLRRASDTSHGKHAGRLLELLSEKGLASRMHDGMDVFADATGECLLAMFTLKTAAAQEQPTELPTLLKEATRLEMSGDLEAALGKFKAYQVAAADRLLALRSYIHEAHIEMKLGRASEALKALDRAYDMTKPKTFNRDVVLELKLRAERAREIRKRINKLKMELLRTERDFDLWSEIGNLQVKAGNLKGARSTFDHIARRYDAPTYRDDRLRARLMRAWCDSRMNRLGPAQEAFDKLVGDAAGVYTEVAILAQFERARTLHLRGYTAEAIRDYDAIVEAYPDMPPRCEAALHFQVGYIKLNEQNDSEGAAKDFDRLKQDRLKDEPFSVLALEIMAAPAM